MIPPIPNTSLSQPDAFQHGTAAAVPNSALSSTQGLTASSGPPQAALHSESASGLHHGGAMADDDAQDGELLDLESDMGGERNGHQPVAEFLYQLTKMLTDDNTEVIEWTDSRIKVHDPQRLEADILHKYFRHSKFASFQRQLNYFGFRKIAGKGKMSPCSYVNDGATSDIRSLLLIKRKTNGSAARKAAMQQRSMNPLLGLNLQSLAAGQMSLGALGAQAFGNLGGPSLANAMALLSENALRAGLEQLQNGNGLTTQQLGLLALQQQQQQLQQLQQQQQLQQNQQTTQQQPQIPPQQAPAQQNHPSQPPPTQPQQQPQASQQQNHAQLLQGLTAQKSMLQSNSLEQLAQLTAQLHNAQQNSGNMAADSLNASSLRAAASGLKSLQNASMMLNSQNASGATAAMANPASAALLAQQQSAAPVSNPASAALQAMDAGSGSAAANSNNLFESALNLKSLLQEHQESANRNQAAANANNAGQNGSSRLAHHRLSSSALFPETMSTLSLGNLLGSSNRLNSLLSLNSLMGSREPSLADFAALNGMHQFPYHAQFPGPSASAPGASASSNAPLSAAELAQRLRQGNF